MADQQQQAPPRTAYAIMAGSLANRPDVTRTAPSTIRIVQPMIGDPQTYMIETVRDESGDTIFVEYADSQGLVRIALPPSVANRIAQQRDALTTKVRKKIGKQQAAERKARGEQPAFLNIKKKGA